MVIDQLEAHIQICTKVCMGSQVIRLRYPNIMLSFFTPTPWSYQVALSLHTEVFEEAANCHLHQKPNLKSCQIDKNKQKSPQPLLIVQMNVSCSDTTGGLKLFHNTVIGSKHSKSVSNILLTFSNILLTFSNIFIDIGSGLKGTFRVSIQLREVQNAVSPKPLTEGLHLGQKSRLLPCVTVTHSLPYLGKSGCSLLSDSQTAKVLTAYDF